VTVPAAKRLRVGVIGCGMIAQVMHLPYLQSLPEEFEIAAICDLSPGLLKHIGDQYGIARERRFTDYRALVGSDVDAVFVLVNGSHAPQALAAAAAGKHVFMEKPLCFTLREADELAAAVRRSGVTLMVGYMKRFDPGYRYGRQLVQAMDDIRYIQINTLHPSEDQYTAYCAATTCRPTSQPSRRPKAKSC
jgi:predicted dehydrogenase